VKVVNIGKETCTHYIGRPGPFGNPFKIGKNATREEVISAFEKYARGNPALLDAIKALPEDAVLGCYCKPEACHGDVIIKLHAELTGKSPQ
jgi:hypothetical protein